MNTLKLRVWHIPQVPMQPFLVEVPTFEEAVRLRDALASYDLFQYENNIKPDYCNASGIQVFDHSLTKQDMHEMELRDAWVDFEDKDELEEIVDNMVKGGFISPQTITVAVSPGMIDAGEEILLNTPGGEIEERSGAIVSQIFQAMALTQKEEME